MKWIPTTEALPTLHGRRSARVLAWNARNRDLAVVSLFVQTSDGRRWWNRGSGVLSFEYFTHWSKISGLPVLDEDAGDTE